MGALIQDLRYAFRQLVKHPGFTLVAVLTLALGIGATTALFTVINGVLVRPLPYPNPDQLLLLYSAYPDRGSNRGTLSRPDFDDWARRSRTIERMGLYTTLPGNLVLSDQEGAREVRTAHVSWGLLSTLGTGPALGRVFREDDETGNPFVVVLSHGFWLRQFGGDSSVVGRTVTLSDKSFQVIGVMPQGFGFPDPNVEAWALLAIIPPENIPMQLRGVRFLRAVGRLARGATPDQARQDLSAIALALSHEYPEPNEGLEAADVRPLRDAVVGNVEMALLILFGAVGLVLLIASANVASLLLARGIARHRELAVRTALGASRRRVVRLLVTESAVLGVLGGVAGCVLAFWGVEVILARSAGIIPRVGEVSPDGRVLAFALAVTLFTVLLFGLLPAWAVARADPARQLGEAGGDRGTTRLRARGGLVAAEVAVAVVLLIGAGLLVRSLWTLSDVNPGFRPDGALALTLTIPTSRYPARADFLGQHDRLLARFRAIPGVEVAGSIRYLPMRGVGETAGWEVPGAPAGQRSERRTAESLQVTPDLFRALGVPLLAGRPVSAEDVDDAPPVIVVSETLARQAFPGQNAVGRIVHVYGETVTIVGVVGDVHQRALETAPTPTIYVPLRQVPRRAMTFVLRTDGNPLTLAAAAERAVHEVDPGQAISEMTPLDAVVGDSIARPRFFTLLLSLFAVLAVALAAVGIYGVLAFAVRQRTRELGIRMALGADRRETLLLVVRQGMRPAGLGLVVGFVAAVGLSHLMRGLLFEIRPLDPITYGVGVVLLSGVALAACWIPGTRAMRVDPMEALRHE
jgi:predicted permease